jgi:hypothetical protein
MTVKTRHYQTEKNLFIDATILMGLLNTFSGATFAPKAAEYQEQEAGCLAVPARERNAAVGDFGRKPIQGVAT